VTVLMDQQKINGWRRGSTKEMHIERSSALRRAMETAPAIAPKVPKKVAPPGANGQDLGSGNPNLIIS